jgi:hypothetical protein
MSLSIGLLTILTGLAIMGFGLFMFYAWLPVFYALVGFDVGILLGRALTGDVDTTAIVLGTAGAFILGVASYVLEPYRRVLLGVSGGILFGFSVSSAFGLDVWLGGFFGRIFALVCGAIGSLLMPRFFDIFVIAASAVSGAAMVLIGANHILPGVQLIDPAAGGALPSLITIILAAAGIGWQRHNIATWVQVLPTCHGVSESSVEDRK